MNIILKISLAALMIFLFQKFWTTALIGAPLNAINFQVTHYQQISSERTSGATDVPVVCLDKATAKKWKISKIVLYDGTSGSKR